MTFDDLHAQLIERGAFIVHCSRPGRGGETLGPPKPLYPDDLKAAIHDLTNDMGRHVCCSVVWQANQNTFGALGVVIKPRQLSDITEVCPIDGGTGGDGKGAGLPLSAETFETTFKNTATYNEWVMIGGEIVGLFVSSIEPLQVARSRSIAGLPASALPTDITPAEIYADFPGMPVFTISGGKIVKFQCGTDPVEGEHPYY